jgi:hypothetical protein
MRCRFPGGGNGFFHRNPPPGTARPASRSNCCSLYAATRSRRTTSTAPSYPRSAARSASPTPMSAGRSPATAPDPPSTAAGCGRGCPPAAGSPTSTAHHPLVKHVRQTGLLNQRHHRHQSRAGHQIRIVEHGRAGRQSWDNLTEIVLPIRADHGSQQTDHCRSKGTFVISRADHQPSPSADSGLSG